MSKPIPLDLEMNIRKVFTIMDKAKGLLEAEAPTSTFILSNLLRHYAKQVLTHSSTAHSSQKVFVI